jgi:hypothetical protein
VTERQRGVLALAAGYLVVVFWAALGALHTIVRADAAYAGTWQITVKSPVTIDLELSYRSPQSSSSVGRDPMPFDEKIYPGLTMTQMKSANGDAHFRIVRDAGVFVCNGYFVNGMGSGVFEYLPSAAYAAALESRGLGRPDEHDQFRLMFADVTLAAIDQLRSAGVSGVSVKSLVSMAEHGVDRPYIASLAAAGVKAGSVDELMRLRDHDVEGDFIAGLARYGYHPSTDDLVRLRDHDVTIDFVARLKSHGYTPTVEDLIRLRDAGV